MLRERLWLKTIKQDESITRSRFVDCPVCKNHSLKLKRTVQVGRCRSCSETYKVIVVFVKTGKGSKTSPTGTDTRSENKAEEKPQPAAESLPSRQPPSNSSPFGSSNEPYPGLSEALFGKNPSDYSTESGTSSN